MAVGSSITGTTTGFGRPNHSPVFYHGGFWWGVFRYATDGDWWLWKLDSGTWTRQSSTGALDTRTSASPDCVLDAANNDVYIFFSHASTSRINVLSYSGGSWTIDGGYPVTVTGITGSDTAIIALAKDGDLFAFTYLSTAVKMNWSTDSGATWNGSAVDIRDSGDELTKSAGLCDAIAFTYSGTDQMGIFYAENAQGEFGFLRLPDGSAPGTKANWVSENPGDPTNSAKSDDHISMVVDSDDNLYVGAKFEGGTGGATTHGLFKRNTSASWSLTEFDTSGSRPGVCIDSTNSTLYYTLHNAGVGVVYYFTTPIGTISMSSEGTILDDDPTPTLINGGMANHLVTGTTDLMVVAYSTDTGTVWYNLFDLAAAAAGVEIFRRRIEGY